VVPPLIEAAPGFASLLFFDGLFKGKTDVEKKWIYRQNRIIKENKESNVA